MILKLLPLIMIFNPVGPNDYAKGIALMETNPNNYYDTANNVLSLSLVCSLDGDYLFLEHQETSLRADPERITLTYTGYSVELNPYDDYYFWQVSVYIYYEYSNSNYNYRTYADIENGSEYTGTVEYYSGQSDIEYTFTIYVNSSSAYNQGYTEGYQEGHNRGEQIGYQEGYTIGKAEGEGVNNVITWFTTIWDGITDFMGLQIAPNLTIGSIITIPLVVGVLFFVLKVLIQ